MRTCNASAGDVLLRWPFGYALPINAYAYAGPPHAWLLEMEVVAKADKEAQQDKDNRSGYPDLA